MSTRVVALLAVAAVTGLASAQSIQVGPGTAGDVGPSPFTSRASLLWDNGDTDGSNGYSEAVNTVFGFNRSLLDDFVVSDAAGWHISDYHGLYLWNSGGVGLGSDVNLTFWSDAGGVPGAPIASTSNTSYTETPTGRVFFGRPEVAVDVEFAPVTLGPGTYWVEMQMVGVDNAFHMVRSTISGSESWINYEDFGGMFPGSAVFGVPADIAYQLTGEVVPAPAGLAVLGLAGLGARRRRR